MRRPLVAVVALLLGVFAVHAEPERVGEEVYKKLETPHPYAASVEGRTDLVWSERIAHPGAAYVALHFSKFRLAEGDFVIVRSPDGSQAWRYEGLGRGSLGESKDGFWATHIKGDSAIVELWATGPRNEYGFAIDRYARGYRPEEMGLGSPVQESICGVDDSTWAKCYQFSEPSMYEKGRAVARLLINGSGLCTGWLVGSGGHLMTNNHCIESASDATNTDYEFMAEGATCATSCAAQLSCPGTMIAGGALVQTDANLDFSLVLLSQNPTPTYGYLKLRTTNPALDERIYIVGHPGGKGKRFSVTSSAASDGSGFCEIFNLNASPCGAGSPYTEIGYFCDTEGGSSGSPVLAYADHKVVSLHHCGNCPNLGLDITDIITTLGANLPPNATFDPFGIVTLDRNRYGCSDAIGIEVRDDSLAGFGAIAVVLASSVEGGGETVGLAENPPGSARFTGTFPTTALPPATGDGALSVADGATITVTYLDADDGAGGVNVPRTDTALADCAPPVITAVQSSNVQGSQADILFTSSEPCTTVVTYGLAATPPPAQTASNAALVTSHSIRLSGLAPCNAHLFSVSCVDGSGNGATNDNSGAYYSFTTGTNSSPTYVSTSTPVPIPDNNAAGAVATIPVSDINTVLDVNVKIGITHTFVSDLVIYLIGPDGTQAILSNRRPTAGGGINFTNTVFDDQATTPISSVTIAQNPYTGSYVPDQPLAAFQGRSVTGTWTLKVADVAGSDVGTIDKLELSFTYPAQPCGPAAVRHGAAIVADVCSGSGGGGADGYWDDGEEAQISVTLRNSGTVPLTAVSARLVPLTAGVTVVDDTAAFADLAIGATALSQAPHFTARLPEGFPCGSPASFRVDIFAAQGSFTDSLSLVSGRILPGGGTALDESFAGGIPAGWTIVDGGSGGNAAATWTAANPGARTFVAPIVAPVAIVDSDNAGSAATQDEQLLTPVLDLSTATSVTLDFDQYFRQYFSSLDEKGDVDVRSSLTGGAWVNVLRNSGATSPNPEHRTIDITSQAAGAADAQIRFRYYDAQWEWYWAVDNVRVTYAAPGGCLQSSCSPLSPPGEVPSPSLVWGSTKEELTWDAVAGATLYRVYRGAAADLPKLLDGSLDSCLAATSASPSVSGLAAVPAELVWWLVRAANAAGEGPAGSATAGPRMLDSVGACP